MESDDLDRLIDELEYAVRTAIPLQTRWQPIWASIRTIGASFKGTRYPSRREKDAAWERFQALVQRVKKAQAEENTLRERRADLSASRKYKILARISQAMPTSGLEDIGYMLMGGPFIDMARDGISALLGEGPVDRIKEELQRRSKALSEAWELFAEYKADLLGRDKREVFEALSNAKERLQQDWDRWKTANHEAYEARQRAREERNARHAARTERIENNIEKNTERLGRLLDILADREAHLETLLEKRSSARSDEYRERVDGWIEEEEERIRGLRDKISVVQEWIAEDRAKLRSG